MLYSYSFQNKKRDLSDVLSTVIRDEPRFISNFQTVENATQQKHEWLEDQIAGRAVTVSGAVSGLACPASAADLAKLRVGTLLVIQNDSALFRVVAVEEDSFTVELVAANGSESSAPAQGQTLNLVSTPMPEGSSSGDGDATGDSEGGCQSVMLSGALPLLALLAVPAILCKPISDAKKRRNQ